MAEASEGTQLEKPWQDLFYHRTSPYYGYVKSEAEASDIIDEFCTTTSTYYVETRCTKNFGDYDIFKDEQHHFIRFNEDGKVKNSSPIKLDGIPFIIVGNKIMECHQGPDRRGSKADKQQHDHQYKQNPSKGKITGSKKLGCPAAIALREVILFPEYKIPRETHHCQQEASLCLRADLESVSGEDVKYERRIYIDFPNEDSHVGHIMGDAAALKAPIDERVVNHVYKLVEDGVYNVNEMKRHVKIYVKELFGSGNLPKCINRKFYPSRQDLRKMIYRKRIKLMRGLLDQERLQEKVAVWNKEGGHHVYLRLSATVDRPINEDEDNDPEIISRMSKEPFLFIYQSEFQKKMLHKYGSEMVFLDATYKTTKYALPLFFLCVLTNSGYFVVATFVLESEDSASLTEALQKLKEMNEDWKSSCFMIDSSEVEMIAIKNCFQDADVYICDFHRKQSWMRWVKTIKHGVSNNQDDVMNLLNCVAESLTEEDFKKNVVALKESIYWKQDAFRNYIDKQWLNGNKHKNWVWAYRGNWLTLVINTNNGVEAQNKVFKYEYLAPYKEKSVSGLMNCLVNEFFEDNYRKYLDANVSMSSGWRKADHHIPIEYQHRPPFFIQHMRESAIKAETIKAADVTIVSEGKFRVASGFKAYTVTICNPNNLPACECLMFRKTHLPCKHFAAVFQHTDITFDNLPANYINYPVFTIDKDCVGDDITKLFDKDHEAPVSLSDNVEDSNVNYKHSTSNLVEDVPETSASSVSTAGKRLRESCSKIVNLSFLIPSQEVLNQANEDLHLLINFLQENCPSENGLPLLNEKEKPPTSKKSIQRKRKILEDLPKAKKRKLREPKVKTMIQKPIYEERCKPTQHHDILPECKEQLAKIKQHQTDTNTAAESNLKPQSMTFTELPFIKKEPVQKRSNVAAMKSMRVGCNSFTSQDLSTLNGSNWLNDKVMQAYLGLLMLERNRNEPGCLLVLPSFLATKWEQHRYNEWLFMEIQFSKYHWILIPVCTKNHWILLVANMVEHRFAVLNSMKRAYPVQREMFTHWLMFMTCRQRKTNEPFVKWSCIDYDEEQQHDGHSCGPFALMFAEALISEADVKFIKQEHMKEARLYIKNRLVNSAKKNDRSICDLPFCEGSANLKNSTLIECKRCCGLVHAECAQVERKKDYACLSCEQADFNTSCKLQSCSDESVKT